MRVYILLTDVGEGYKILGVYALADDADYAKAQMMVSDPLNIFIVEEYEVQ